MNNQDLQNQDLQNQGLQNQKSKNVVITLKNVVYNYKDYDDDGREIQTHRGVNDLSLTVNEGEFLALVGHNGSGKSTLAKTFNGLIIPQRGSVEVLGLNPSIEKQLFEIRSQVGMVFQNPDNQTVASIVEDDVAFGPENLGIEHPELRQRVDDALKAVNMLDYAQKTPSRLSGGQKQRVAIAGALALKPKILVLDEATSMLDPVGRKEVMDNVVALNKAGMTIIAITHFMDEATLADRIVVLAEGKIVLQGTPTEIFSQKARLEELGLKTPRSIDLATQLRQNGFDVDPTEQDIVKLGESICQSL